MIEWTHTQVIFLVLVSFVSGVRLSKNTGWIL